MKNGLGVRGNRGERLQCSRVWEFYLSPGGDKNIIQKEVLFTLTEVAFGDIFREFFIRRKYVLVDAMSWVGGEME